MNTPPKKSDAARPAPAVAPDCGRCQGRGRLEATPTHPHTWGLPCFVCAGTGQEPASTHFRCECAGNVPFKRIAAAMGGLVLADYAWGR